MIDLTPKPEVLTPEPEHTARTMGFPDAIKEIILGRKVARVSWGNEDFCLLKDGWLTIFTKGDFHTWSVSDGDLEGQDWVVVYETN